MQIMVDKFGDCTVLDEQTLLENVQTIKKIIVTSGKYKDYYDEIAASIKLGYVPYRLSKDSTSSPPISIRLIIRFGVSDHLVRSLNW